MPFARIQSLAALGAALAAVVIPLSAASAPVSPSQVLAKADERLGSQYVQIRERRGGALEADDKTLSPYFYVDGGDPETERLPLKETSAQVQISGVIARVKVRQVFENSGSKPIEAVYVFPGSTRAAVHGMRMKIGARIVEAKIEKKQTAREQYEAAKQQGKRASLLEQQRPNVFTMNVANVMPNDRIEVELDYSELLVPEDSVYEFVYPAVVGPRYGGGADPAKDKWIANPYLQAGEKEPYKFDIQAHVETGIALKELASPSHQVAVNYLSPSSADMRLQQSGGGNKDFVLRYRLAGDKVETGLLLWQGEQENFFVLMMEPPRRPTLAQIPPREYIFLLDVSGSMHGFPLDTAKELMRNLIGQLRPTDYFNLAFFSGGSYVMSPTGSVAATPANVQRAAELIGRETGGGGTELMGGLRAAYGIPKRVEGLSRSVVVVTDGYVGVEAQAFKFVRENLHQANLFAFGIGSSVNRGLIEGMARAGLGEPFVVLNPAKAREQADKLREYIQRPVLTGIDVSFPGFEAYEVAPAKVPDLMAQRPLVVFGKYKGEPRGAVQVRGFTGGGRFNQAIEVEPKAAKAENAPLRWLWARRWVEILDDELALGAAKELEEAITDLGLAYRLLTSYTSFIAVDSEIANRSGSAQQVAQPLPMPEGVSNYAVGSGGFAATASAPAPAPMRRAMQKSYSGAGRAAPQADREAARPATPKALSRPAELAEDCAAEPAARQERALDEKQAKGKADSLPRFNVRRPQSAGLADIAPLLRAIETSLRAEAGCLNGAQVTAKLKLTVDATGRVIRVEIVSATDAAVARCLAKRLERLATATRALAGNGTLEITVTAQ